MLWYLGVMFEGRGLQLSSIGVLDVGGTCILY